jgi:dolichyl-phosphate-mannose-protein mannosyltransferase
VSAPPTSPAEAPEPVSGPPPPPPRDARRLEDEGPRSWLYDHLRLRRFDVLAMGILLVVAFVFRFFSPIFPDLFAGKGFIGNCVQSTPIDARGAKGTLCGLSYPYQQANPQSGEPAEGQVFDEIYFGVFAHNDLKGVSYFDPEPPVAKYLIAAGEWGYGEWRKVTQGLPGDPADLGFNTFGWRIMVCIFGTLAVPLMYLLAFKLWPNRWFAVAAGVLCCFDGMFFVQSRIGMIDIFPIFFVMLAYTLFLFHLESRTPQRAVITLLLTGTVLGVAIASKWIALAALASIVFFLVARPIVRRVGVRIGEWSWRPPVAGPLLPGNTNWLIYLCAGVTALFTIPVAIYLLSWIPFFTRGQFHTLQDLLTYQYQVYMYHATLTATHPYGSKWFQWPFSIRPVAYYYQGDGLGLDASSGQQLVAGIVNLGNPAIWWASVPALLALPYFIVKDRSWPATVILVGFLTQYLPFIKISRVMFQYHYFGGLIFAILALAYVLARVHQARLVVAVGFDGESDSAGETRVPTGWILPAFLVLAVVAFLYFYPVWTGLPISFTSYISGFPAGKMWFPSWI